MTTNADQPALSPTPEQRIADLERDVQRYRRLFESLPVPVWYHDALGQPALSNAAMQRMLKLPAEQMLAADEAKSQVLGALHASQNGGSHLVHTAEDGAQSYYTLHSCDLATDAGPALLIYLEDAGVEQSLASALAARESQLSSLVANLPGMAYQFEMRPDGTYGCPYVSEGSRLIYGLEPGELMERPILIFERAFAEDREAFRQSGTEAARAFAPWVWEGRIERADGSVIWAHCVAQPAAQPGGGLRWNGMMIDVTERKIAELERMESERRLIQFMDAMPIGVYVQDSTRMPTYVNAPATEILGRGIAGAAQRGEVVEMYKIYREGTDELYPFTELPSARALRGEAATLDDLEIAREDGRRMAIEASGKPIFDDAGKLLYTVTTFRDITQAKQRAREYGELQEEIIRVQANALAELSTPLIQLDDATVLMPLIGAVDSQRAQHIIEVLLHGVSESRARVALVDLTGVPVVDTQVASAIIMAAQSVRLLGAEVVLTGIRPEIAQTLVSLGIDLSSMHTRSNLQMGIRFALERNAVALARR
ncbi:MAG TPA: PAS domain S-box protein [Herpetosiphonaceae bacterium]